MLASQACAEQIDKQGSELHFDSVKLQEQYWLAAQVLKSEMVWHTDGHKLMVARFVLMQRLPNVAAMVPFKMTSECAEGGGVASALIEAFKSANPKEVLMLYAKSVTPLA